MCTDHPSSSRHFLPLTPPTLHFDQASAVDGSASDQETILESPTDSLTHGVWPHRFCGDPVSRGLDHLQLHPTRRAEKRLVSSRLGSSSSSPKERRKKCKMNMNMAKTGSIAALPGIQTPLATYVAQMVVWLWYGEFQNQSQSPSETFSPHSPPIPNNPFDVTIEPPPRVTPLMVHPSSQFSEFVARLLQVTMVSHSVTVVALLYVYRLKMNNQFFSTPGSEQRPFVAGLMLSNKYLDDNTYTNSTWAELTGIPLPEINRMESELLHGLEYKLGVHISEYQRWKTLLDEFMTSRGPGGAAGRHARQLSMSKASHIPRLLTTPVTIAPGSSSMGRARSASPPRFNPSADASYVFPQVYDHSRKYSAVDIYPSNQTPVETTYTNVAQPVLSSQRLQPNLPVIRARPAMNHQNSNSSLNRSTSLNRQYSRLGSQPDDNSSRERRGSVGHVYGIPLDQGQIHSGPITPYGQMIVGSQGEWDGGRALLAPYECQAQPQLVPPEHLMFYSLAAAPHPGADGAPRKAILRHQDPSISFSFPPAPNPNYMATPIYQLPSTAPYSYEDISMSESNPSPQALYPPSMFEVNQIPSASGRLNSHNTPIPYNPYDLRIFSPVYADPEPAQFANAGPPGYVYNPPSMTWHQQYPQMPPVASETNGLGINMNMGISGVATSALPSGVPGGTNTNRWSLGSDGGGGPKSVRGAGGLMWANNGSRSEWSSPLVKFDQP
ncbi:hypothetical protein IAR55_006198 [Kwoniella newhampshirensis]|uniref:Cyclin n=1 Tax=Kwoniella newhampshirensis TaxID=1651941 RepID=A0AAW0YUY2_9TREE